MDDIKSLKNLISECQVVDLTHSICDQMPAAPGHNPFQHIIWNSPELGDPAKSYQIILNEHTGTHIDAPGHFIQEGSSENLWIDQIPLKSLFCSCKVIKQSGLQGGESISKTYIQSWEDSNKKIQKGDGVLFHTGWDHLFMSCCVNGLYTDSWPGLGADSADYLISKGVSLVGIDTVSMDSSEAKEFPSHKKLLSNNIYIFENLNNLFRIDKECFLIALPLPIQKGTASPVRAIAFIND